MSGGRERGAERGAEPAGRLCACKSCGGVFVQENTEGRPAEWCGHQWCELRRGEHKQWGRFLTRCKSCLGVVLWDEARQRWSHSLDSGGHGVALMGGVPGSKRLRPAKPPAVRPREPAHSEAEKQEGAA